VAFECGKNLVSFVVATLSDEKTRRIWKEWA
jgi:hypothetical protein